MASKGALSIKVVPLTLVGALVASCSGGLAVRLEYAQQLVGDVRPHADGSGVKALHWISAETVEIAHNGLEHELTLLTGARVFREQAPVLAKLGLIDSKQLAQLQDVSGLGDTHFGGFAVPPKGLIYVRSDVEPSPELLSHELSHVLSYRLGYLETSRLRFDEGGPIDSRWIDLDALMAAWALEEATAELTGQSASVWRESGRLGLSEVWRSSLTLEGVLAKTAMTGPSTITRPDGTRIEIKSGETYALEEEHDLARKLLAFAYGWSPELVKRTAPLSSEDVDLDVSFARVWRSFSYTTAKVMFPGEDAQRSELAAKLRTALKGKDMPIAGATRAGAFFVREGLRRMAKLDPYSATARVQKFNDDVVLRSTDDALLWIVQWRDDAAAAWFAKTYESAMPEASVQVRGTYVLVTVGSFEQADQLAQVLLPD